MSPAPWLSIVMPTHNGERWIEATLQSLVAQERRDFECIIIDSSNSAATLTIAEQFSEHLNITAHSRPDLLPWPAKTNLGVELARADYICMLHQDDLWRPDRSEKIYEWLRVYPDAALHLHASLIVDSDGRTLGTWRCPLPADGKPIPSALLLERLLVQNFVAIPAPIIKRASYLDVGGMNPALWYTADWDLYLKLISAGAVYYHPEPLACFRIHGSSLTISGSRKISDFREQLEIVLDRYAQGLPLPRRAPVLRAARASIEINIALAAANNRSFRELLSVLASFIGLGPYGAWRYLRDSRIVERALPRVRARLAGRI